MCQYVHLYMCQYVHLDRYIFVLISLIVLFALSFFPEDFPPLLQNQNILFKACQAFLCIFSSFHSFQLFLVYLVKPVYLKLNFLLT